MWHPSLVIFEGKILNEFLFRLVNFLERQKMEGLIKRSKEFLAEIAEFVRNYEWALCRNCIMHTAGFVYTLRYFV